MAELAGRLYVPKLYSITRKRKPVIDLLERAVEESGGRVVYSSFRDERVAPVYLGAEDRDGHRYGMLVYPFTTTRRSIKNRPSDERRTQIRLGDPKRVREEENPIGIDVAGVDVTLVLAVDPEAEIIVGLDPMVYAELPMGISIYYKDSQASAVDADGWAVWERDRADGKRRARLEGLETLVGFKPHRLLDYVRFEARATALGLAPALRAALAERVANVSQSHDLEEAFGLDAATILDIVNANFRLGVAVRGGVAEHHLGRQLAGDPAVATVSPIDEDGKPDFDVTLVDGRRLLVECKTASQKPYANGDLKVEAQKTRDSGAGRKYTFDQFDVLAACLFSASGLWEFRYQWTSELSPWSEDPSRMAAIQRIDQTWAQSLSALVGA